MPAKTPPTSPVKTTPPPPTIRPLKPTDYPVKASRVIVIDFEGYKDQPPVFAGVWEDGHFRVVILDERFKALVKLGHPFVKYQSIKRFLRRMHRRALVHQKYLVGYSEHESTVFADCYGDISEVYLNARMPLSRWFTLNDRENRPNPFGLKDLMKYFEYKAYKEYPHQGVTTVLTQVLKQLINHEGDVQRLTPLAASRWKELLDYNKQDVLGLMYVMKRAKLLAFQPYLAYDIELVGYCLEEPPFFGGSDMGSYVHAKSLHDAGIPVKGMICYEMIGYYSDEPGSQPVPDPSLVGLVPTVGNFIGVIGRPENGEFNQAFYQAMAKDSEIEVVGIGLPDQHFPSALSGLVGLSDQRNYWKFGYPALMINDTSYVRNPHYHQVTDTMDTLDFDRLTQTVNSAYRGIVGLPS